MDVIDATTPGHEPLLERISVLEREREQLRAENEQLRGDRIRFYERLVDWAPVGLAYFDRDLVYRLCNQTNASYIGKPLDQIIGHRLQDVVPENPAVWAAVEHVLTSGEPYPLQLMSVVFAGREDEGPHDFLIAFMPDSDGNDDTHGVYVYAREITDITRTQAALRFLSEASIRLAASLDSDAVMNAIIDLAVPFLADFCVIDIVSDSATASRSAAHVDPARAAMLEEIRRRYPIDASLETPLSCAVRTQGSFLIEEITDDHLRSFARDADHLEMLRTLGHRSVMFVPLIARDRMLGVISFGHGPSRRTYGQNDLALAEELARRAAVAIDTAMLFERVQAAEVRYRGVFDGVADAILVFDRSARVIEVNASASAMFGLPPADLARQSIADLAVVRQEWANRELRRLRRQGSWHGEVEMRRNDGTTLPVEAQVTRLAMPDAPVYIAVLRDISHRRELERMQRELTAMVTHELKGPLTSIKGFAQLMQRRQAFDERRVDAIVTQANQLERLINDMTDATRGESGRLDLRREPVDLVALAEAAVEQARALTAVHDLQLDVPEHPVVGNWDPHRLSQVLQNLLSNAIKYSPDGGTITLSVVDAASTARVSVSDQGVGIPEDMLGRVFERFYRVQGANRGSAQGLGLGLFIARLLVETHGGRISVESTPGRGSTFTVSLSLENAAS